MSFGGAPKYEKLNEELIIKYIDKTNIDEMLELGQWMHAKIRTTEALRYAISNYDRFQNPSLKKWVFEVFEQHLLKSQAARIPISLLERLSDILINHYEEVFQTGLIEKYVFNSMIVVLSMVLYPNFCPDFFSLDNSNGILRRMARKPLLEYLISLGRHLAGVHVSIFVIKRPEEFIQCMFDDGSQRTIIKVLVDMMETPDEQLANAWGRILKIFAPQNVLAEGFTAKLRLICENPETIMFFVAMLESLGVDPFESVSQEIANQVLSLFDALEIGQILHDYVGNLSHVPVQRIVNVLLRLQNIPKGVYERCIPLVLLALEKVPSWTDEFASQIERVFSGTGYRNELFEALLAILIQLFDDFERNMDKEIEKTTKIGMRLMLRLISLLEKADACEAFEKVIDTLSISNPTRMFLLFSSVAHGAKKLPAKGILLVKLSEKFGQMVLEMKLENEQDLRIKTKFCKLLLMSSYNYNRPFVLFEFASQIIDCVLLHDLRNVRILPKLIRETAQYRQENAEQCLENIIGLIKTKNIVLLDCAREMLAQISPKLNQDTKNSYFHALMDVFVSCFTEESFRDLPMSDFDVFMKCLSQISSGCARENDLIPFLIHIREGIDGDAEKLKIFIAQIPAIAGTQSLQLWVDGIHILIKENVVIDLEVFTALQNITSDSVSEHLGEVVTIMIKTLRNHRRRDNPRRFGMPDSSSTVLETAILLSLKVLEGLSQEDVLYVMCQALDRISQVEASEMLLSKFLSYAQKNFDVSQLMELAKAVSHGLCTMIRRVESGERRPESYLPSFHQYLMFLSGASQKLGRDAVSDILTEEFRKWQQSNDVTGCCTQFVLAGDIDIVVLEDKFKALNHTSQILCPAQLTKSFGY